jgi:hypothetical protein
MESSEDGDIRSSVATILPELIRTSVTEVTWTSIAAQPGIQDTFTAALPENNTQRGDGLLAELVDSFFEDVESTSAEDIASVISERRSDTAAAINTTHRREDAFTATTAERRITTDLGFLGWLIAQLNTD